MVIMEKQFISYELALKLKELGFDEECFKTYNEDGIMFNGHSSGKYYYPVLIPSKKNN